MIGLDNGRKKINKSMSPEEIWLLFERLVSHHGASFLHHHCFDLWRHLKRKEKLWDKCIKTKH